MPGGLIRVNMGHPVLESERIPVSGPPRRVVAEEIEAGKEKFYYTAVSMGNPHCVIFLKEGQAASASSHGPLLEKHAFFPQGANVEFCRVNNPSEVIVSVWERGAGETLACGTGACAVVVAGVLQGLLERKAAVLPGGAADRLVHQLPGRWKARPPLSEGTVDGITGQERIQETAELEAGLAAFRLQNRSRTENR